ncbi:hypothetical protein [Comamonas sp. GB3 AK4-5]|uniref:hypothetical protein n=1 Tax=Comamonas sp. GB3 AK4-5 TaxID=3231487 RepID=UPI00351F3F6F
MATRGRKSAASVAVAAQVGPLVSESRLTPSMHLSDAEQAVWARLVNDQPAAAFTETHRQMLEMYCQHVVQAQVLADELQSFEREWLRTDDGLKRYDKLLAMREREVRSASSLATRLRITRQATTDPKTVGRSAAGLVRTPKPWELPA